MDPLTIVIALLVIVFVVLVFLGNARQKKISNGTIVLSDKFNTFAVVAFILGFFVSIAAIVLGHIALWQIKRTHERGWGLAVASLILGYFGLVAGFLVLVYFMSFGKY